jgi:hypothetical protein
MLYFIGGASRAGKTLMAQRILAERRLAYLSLDCLVMGFTNGVPHYGIHDKLMPDEIAERLWPFLRATCESMLWCDLDYVIEGEAILPALLRDLSDEHPGRLRACFVGFADIGIDEKLRQLRAHSDERTDWLARESDAYVRDHVANMVAFSRRLREDCAQHGLRYFETSADFTAATDAARRHLLGEAGA